MQASGGSPTRHCVGSTAATPSIATSRGWDSFEPWLGRIETMAPEKIWAIAEGVPPEWYGGELEALERLDTDQLIARRSRVRELIDEFREIDRGSRFQNG